MSESHIGIKVADGTFYPILDKELGGRKKLILTTVNDDQSNVQIDLYEGEGEMSSSNKYVGSLLIEDLETGPAGEAEVELLVGLETDGNLLAQAQDLRSGESQSLNVSLESLADDAIYDMPDFELDNEFEPWSDSSDETAATADFDDDVPSDEFAAGAYERDLLSDTEGTSEEPEYIEPPKRKPFLLALFIIVGIAAVAALSIFLFKVFEGPTIPPLEAKAKQEAAAAEESKSSQQERTGNTSDAAAEENAAEESTVAANDSAAAPAAEEAPQTQNTPAAETPQIGGVWYWISWGDTLWDISSSFYRNPWHYGRIAEENSISNPDLILAGSKIYIPEKQQ